MTPGSPKLGPNKPRQHLPYLPPLRSLLSISLSFFASFALHYRPFVLCSLRALAYSILLNHCDDQQ